MGDKKDKKDKELEDGGDPHAATRLNPKRADSSSGAASDSDATIVKSSTDKPASGKTSTAASSDDVHTRLMKKAESKSSAPDAQNTVLHTAATAAEKSQVSAEASAAESNTNTSSKTQATKTEATKIARPNNLKFSGKIDGSRSSTSTGPTKAASAATNTGGTNTGGTSTAQTKVGQPDTSDAPITKIERMERTPRPSKVHREIDVGSVIRDRFVLQEVLGRGGMGAVYRALDLIKKEAGDDNPYIAIKLLSGDFKDHPHAFVTLQREAKKTQELAHPNIVTVFDFDREEDVVYLTMEQLAGAPLIDVIRGKTNRVLDDKDKISIIEQIARGLAYAHEKGIVHSDLKPANLFLTDDGVIKILDFGIARAASTELYQDSFDAGQLGALTMTYASPEMIRFEPPHPSDDIYALGIIICELLSGVHPFDRKDAKTAFDEHLQPKIPDVKNPFLKKCIVKTLSLQRDTRIPDASEFLRRFNNAVAAPKRIASVAAIVVLALVANFFYIQSIDEAIPFDALPKEEQVAFKELIEEGITALKFQDFNTAVVSFNSAYEIHSTNDDIEKAQKKIVKIFSENYKKAEDEKTKEFFQSQLEDLKRYPAFKNIEIK